MSAREQLEQMEAFLKVARNTAAMPTRRIEALDKAIECQARALWLMLDQIERQASNVTEGGTA